MVCSWHRRAMWWWVAYFAVGVCVDRCICTKGGSCIFSLGYVYMGVSDLVWTLLIPDVMTARFWTNGMIRMTSCAINSSCTLLFLFGLWLFKLWMSSSDVWPSPTPDRPADHSDLNCLIILMLFRQIKLLCRLRNTRSAGYIKIALEEGTRLHEPPSAVTPSVRLCRVFSPMDTVRSGHSRGICPSGGTLGILRSGRSLIAKLWLLPSGPHFSPRVPLLVFFLWTGFNSVSDAR